MGSVFFSRGRGPRVCAVSGVVYLLTLVCGKFKAETAVIKAAFLRKTYNAVIEVKLRFVCFRFGGGIIIV